MVEVDISIYYYALVSYSSNNIYILFSTGSILSDSELNDEFTRDFLDTISDNVLSMIDLGFAKTKIVLCGHSMGCVLSLSTAQILQHKNMDLFNSKIIVVGSCPTKFLLEQEAARFHDLPNAKIFVYCNQKDGNTVYLDCFMDKGSKNRVNYKPFICIGPEATEWNISDGEYVVKYIEDKMSCMEKHKWNNYYILLRQIYSMTTGGKRTKAKKAKKEKKEKTKTKKGIKKGKQSNYRRKGHKTKRRF
jgi:hypothetical protein